MVFHFTTVLLRLISLVPAKIECATRVEVGSAPTDFLRAFLFNSQAEGNLDSADWRGLVLWIRNLKKKKPANESSLALNMTLARAIWRSSKPCFMPRRVQR